MTPSAETPLSMPRRLAIRLLHEAQIATEPFVGLVSAPVAPEAEPDAWHPVTAAAGIVTLPEALARQGRRAWALYFFRPSLPTAPVVEDFALQPALLRLTASLATKGVLQLRAWHCLDSRVFECELHIHD
ncbi:MAG: hypothetical protein NVS9B10_28330 [Nevskia sp.]